MMKKIKSFIPKGYALMALLGVLVSCACSKKSTDKIVPINGTALKVMTYNTHHCSPPAKTEFDIDMQAIANVINNESPDLVALQEIDVKTTRSGIDRNQAAELAQLTGMNHFFAKALDYRGGEYGVAILSRFPILESDKQLLPKKTGIDGEQRVIAWVTVEIADNKKLIFASTHFDIADHRLVQAQRVQEIFKDAPYPVVLGGDFNDTPGSEPINYLDQYFTRSCPLICPLTSPADLPKKAIDLVFYAPKVDFEVKKTYTVPERSASDHLPLVVDFMIK